MVLAIALTCTLTLGMPRRAASDCVHTRSCIGMAERLKGRLLEDERLVDVVCGPDAYRELPRLLTQVGKS